MYDLTCFFNFPASKGGKGGEREGGGKRKVIVSISLVNLFLALKLLRWKILGFTVPLLGNVNQLVCLRCEREKGEGELTK